MFEDLEIRRKKETYAEYPRENKPKMEIKKD